MSAAQPARTVADGLPGPLPEGETILWQGSPKAAAVVRSVLHLRMWLVYFAAIGLVVAGQAWNAGRGPGPETVATSLIAVAAAATLLVALIWGFALLVGRTTRYTITSRRIVMRIGVALPMTLNLPFAIIESADLRLRSDGTGDLPISLSGRGRIGYIHLWPHARPWHLSHPQPMLRCVPEAGQVAAVLARALGGGPLGRAAAARDDLTREEAARQQPAAPQPSVAA